MISSEPVTPKSFIVPLLGNEHDPELDMDEQNIVDSQNSEANQGDRNLPRPSSLRMLLRKPTHTVHYYWRKFDDCFMRPVFGGRGFVPFVPGSPTEQTVQQWQEESKR